MMYPLIDFFAKYSLRRHYRDLALIAGMTDSEFMSQIVELKAHKSIAFRAVCAQRWAKITFPADDYKDREDDAWLIWGDGPDEVRPAKRPPSVRLGSAAYHVSAREDNRWPAGMAHCR